MIKIILYGILLSAAVTGLFYLLSRLQMKAWLKEIDLVFGKKFVEYTNKKAKDGNETQK